jgi:ankyrin repeat protein
VELAQQLLQLGADPAADDARYGLTPLHLACMGRVNKARQMDEMAGACESLQKMQVCTNDGTHVVDA